MLVLSRGTQGMFIPPPEKWEHTSSLHGWMASLGHEYKALCTGLLGLSGLRRAYGHPRWS